MNEKVIVAAINRIADAPDPAMRVKALLDEITRHIDGDDFQLEDFIDELEDKAVFVAAAIVSGGHIHTDMSIVFEGRATGL